LNFVYTFNVNLRGADLGNILARSGPSSGILQDCPRTCKLTYPEIRYTFDGRDSAIEPTQGIYTSVSLQQTVKLASLSTFSYFRLNPDFRVYLPFTKFMVLAGRVEYGGLFSQDGSNGPFTQRFFFGGQNEQRGYAPLRQGPKLGTQPCTVGTDPGCTQPWARVSVPIGGKAALLFSGEVRIHADFILKHLGIVPFLDASKVGDDPRNPLSGGLELAPGLGLRYLTAFGPIRLDVGWLANPKDVIMAEQLGKDAAGNTVVKVAQTRVSVHCSSSDRSCIHESRFAFHVTLGEAF
jgi:outer membrane protein assembly factor BamA